jgi:hypothetical protein
VTRSGVLLLIVCGLLAGCSDGEGTPQAQREEAASELEDVPLREDEVPESLETAEQATGPIDSLREVLPPRLLLPNRPPLPGRFSDAFRGGYETVYIRGGGGGPASAASTALRFQDGSTAGAFLAFFQDVQVSAGRDIGREDVPISDLGDRAFGWHLTEPQAESSTVVWQRGDLVLTVTMAGPIGTACVDRTLALARQVDGRLA